MKIKISILALWLFFLFISCETNTDSLMEAPSGTYSYQGWDSTGVLIVTGSLSFTSLDSGSVSGTWELTNLHQREDIGIQNGTGQFEGFITNNTIDINLQPNNADHNVILTGSISKNKIEGFWKWVTFTGITNKGPFLAKRH
ncbi:MAG: hypothetical protein Kow00108_17940 [Calditrichia bacterium]